MNPLNAWTLLTTRSIGIGFEPSGWGSMKPSDVALALRGLERPRFLLGMAALCGDRAGLPELVVCVREHVVEPAGDFCEWMKDNTRSVRTRTYNRVSELLVFEAVNRDQLDRGIRCFVCSGKGVYAPPDDIFKLTTEQKQERARRADVRQVRARLRALKRRAAQLALELKDAGKRADKVKTKRFQRVLRWSNQLSQMAGVSQYPGQCITCRGTGAVRLNGVHRAWLSGFEYHEWAKDWARRYDPLQHEVDGWLSDCLTHVRESFQGRAA
jgi:hypothetical protein